MHLAEGILPAQWALAWAVPAAVGVGVGLRSVRKRSEEDPSFKSLVALMGAAVFAISLMPIPVPVAGSVSHPAGTPLAAIVVGPGASILIAAISLLLQALFFAHGGLTTLGANIVSEGIVGSLVGFGVFVLFRKTGRSIFWAGFAAGLLGDLAVYFTTAVELTLGLFPAGQFWSHVWPIFLAFMPTQVPLALLEGVLTGGVLQTLAELRPDVATRLGVSQRVPGAAPRPTRTQRARAWWRRTDGRVRTGVLAAAITAGLFVGWGLLWALARQTSSWVGLDEGVMERVAAEAGRPAWQPFVNTDVGDLLLYVFFVGSLLAGLVIGWLVRGLRRGATAPDDGDACASTGWIPWRWVGLAAAAVLALLVLWAAAAPSLSVGPVDGEALRRIGGTLSHPTRQSYLMNMGGDAMLFLFMVSGLATGMIAGYLLRSRLRGRLRLRLPHLHGQHDVRTGDHMAWQAGALGSMDARLKLAVVAVLLVANLVVGWELSLLLLVAVLGILLAVQRVPLFSLVVRLAPALILSFVLVLLRGFTVPGRELVALQLTPSLRIAFTLDGVLSGVQLGLVILAGVSLVLLLGLTTPLPHLLSALRWYRVPPLLIDVGTLMYRYLFLFVEEAGRMRQAQKLRGPDVPWRKAMGGVNSLGANLLIRSYDRSLRVSDAQRLRGGDSGGGRS